MRLLVVHVLLQLSLSKANLRMDCYLQQKFAEGSAPYFSLLGPSHLKILSKRRITKFNFFQLAFKS